MSAQARLQTLLYILGACEGNELYTKQNGLDNYTLVNGLDNFRLFIFTCGHGLGISA